MARLPITTETLSPMSPDTKIVLNAESVGLTPEQFFRLCRDNPELQFELTARKEIIVMPPEGGETGARSFEINGQLSQWAKQDKSGTGFGSSTAFTLPNGAIRSPDAAWIPRERWQALPKEQREKFAPICPDFVIELRSRTNTVRALRQKMVEYIENGVQLGWLIDPFKKKVYVYRPGHAPKCLDHPKSVSGDPVLPGFVLNLSEVWDTAT